MSNLLTVKDLEAAKKHDTFHSEVITGKAGGVAGGASIDYATNAVTGHLQKTLPNQLSDEAFEHDTQIATHEAEFKSRLLSMRFTPVGNFTDGYDSLTDARQTLLHTDGRYYSWAGSFPHLVAPLTDPLSDTVNWIDRTEDQLRDEIYATTRESIRRSYAEAGLNLVDGSFERGGETTGLDDVLLCEADGKAYGWHLDEIKTVAAGSTPETTGGIGAGAWVDRSGEYIRSYLRHLFPGDHGDHGNVTTPTLGNDLRKIGNVLVADPSKNFMDVMVESPVIWWDDADGYYHMVFTGYGTATGQLQASPCHAKSLDLVNWVTDDQPLLTGTGVPGDPDQFGGTGPYIVKSGSLYHMFYIGLTAAGYESGTKTICHASSPSITNPVWTRHGTIIGLGVVGTNSEWRSSAIWHPSIVKKDDVYYMFFNASGSYPAGQTVTEKIGYAKSSDLYNWTVDDTNSPLIVTADGTWKSHIAGDPSVYKQGNFWFMQYFGADDSGAYDSLAWTTDGAFPLNWTEYDNPILTPTKTGRIDDLYSHKPFIYFCSNRKYHYYTAVSAKSGTRSIALAVSGAAVDQVHYAKDPTIKTIITPNDGYSKTVIKPDGGVGPAFEIIHDAVEQTLKIERPALNGFQAIKLLEINGGPGTDGTVGVRLYGPDGTQVNTTRNGNMAVSMYSKNGDIENSGVNSFCKANNYYDGVSDRFMNAEFGPASQLIVKPSGVYVRTSINTPVTDGVIIWNERII